MRRWAAWLVLASLASAQETAHKAPSWEDLEARVRDLELQQAEQLDDLTFEIEGLEADLARLEAKSRVRTERSNMFNPAVTVFGNFLARADDRAVHLDDDATQPRVDDQFNLREVEIDLRAAIDPWSDGILIASYESETPGESVASIEEGYLDLKKLPLVNSAPGGLKLKLGRFRPGFGRFNQIHLHDLPQPSYPRSLGNFLGPEGYIRDGMEGKFFLPSSSKTQTLEASVGLFNGGGIPIAQNQSRSNLSLLSHLNWFVDLGQGTNLALGASAWQSDSNHRLYGADATYKWKPHAGGQWNSLLAGVELFVADVDETGRSEHPLGLYLWTQFQLSRNLYVGVRYDRAQELEDSGILSETYGTYLTYYTSEFLRFRLGLEHTESDMGLIDGLDTALFEINFIFGSHPVEPYWVNR